MNIKDQGKALKTKSFGYFCELKIFLCLKLISTDELKNHVQKRQRLTPMVDASRVTMSVGVTPVRDPIRSGNPVREPSASETPIARQEFGLIRADCSLEGLLYTLCAPRRKSV